MAHSNFVARTHTSEQVTLHMKFKIVKIVHVSFPRGGASCTACLGVGVSC